MDHGKKKSMEKKTGKKWMKDQNKQINFQNKNRSLRKMKRSSGKQDLPSPLFESFSAAIIAKGLPDKSMAVHGPAVQSTYHGPIRESHRKKANERKGKQRNENEKKTVRKQSSLNHKAREKERASVIQRCSTTADDEASDSKQSVLLAVEAPKSNSGPNRQQPSSFVESARDRFRLLHTEIQKPTTRTVEQMKNRERQRKKEKEGKDSHKTELQAYISFNVQWR